MTAAADNQQVAKITLDIDGKEVAVSYGSSLSYNWAATNTKGKGAGGGGGKKNAGVSSTSTIVTRGEDPAGNAATASVTVTKQ